MELNPLLSRLEKTDLERYMSACKDDLIDFLEDLGLSNTLALRVLDDVRNSISVSFAVLSDVPDKGLIIEEMNTDK